MSADLEPSAEELKARAIAARADDFDEEFEMAINDDGDARLLKLLDQLDDPSHPTEITNRHRYFKELFRLQAELVKLQDWIVHCRQKVVVIFEGRDAAGKGG